MYCDANGRPDPNGDYELIDGKQILRDGRSIRAGRLMMRDSAPKHTLNLTDAERQLADSPQGQMIVAQAKHTHYLRTAYLGDRAPEFTDAQAAAAVRSAVAQSNRTQQFIADYAAETDRLREQSEQARRQANFDLSQRHLAR